MSVDLSVTVQEGAHVTCWLNTNHTNYLDILGGGSLRMKYIGGDISMTGRYTISSGEMKYSLPVIPLKTFEISPDSYIEFTGDIMNPRLSITAKEKNKAMVEENGVKKSVLFECGVVLSKTLQDMGLEFVIEAPEDSYVSDELRAEFMVKLEVLFSVRYIPVVSIVTARFPRSSSVSILSSSLT